MAAPFSDTAPAPSSPITHSAQNTTRTYLVTVHDDNSVTLWKRSARSWEVAATLASQKSAITDFSFSPDANANTFATCNADGTATVYTFATAATTTISSAANLCDADSLSAIAFSDLGQLATLGGGALRIYGKRWGLLTLLDVEGSKLSFAPGGKAVIAGSTIFRCIGDDFEWNFFADIDDSDGILSVDWGRDGLIAVGREDGVEIWQLRRGEPVRIARFEERGVQTVQWDPVGGLLTSVHDDGITKTWAKDGATWKWGLRDSLQSQVDAAA